MNLSTILIALSIAALLVFAIRYLVKNGMCAACEDRAACEAAKKAGVSDSSSCCSGKCSACKYYEYELKASQATHRAGA